LLEATLMRKPVLTVNAEYLKIFGSWSKCTSAEVTLVREYESLFSLSQFEVTKELDRRVHLVIQNHSASSWYPRLLSILLDR